jgi:hypothetical protein
MSENGENNNGFAFNPEYHPEDWTDQGIVDAASWISASEMETSYRVADFKDPRVDDLITKVRILERDNRRLMAILNRVQEDARYQLNRAILAERARRHREMEVLANHLLSRREAVSYDDVVDEIPLYAKEGRGSKTGKTE